MHVELQGQELSQCALPSSDIIPEPTLEERQNEETGKKRKEKFGGLWMLISPMGSQWFEMVLVWDCEEQPDLQVWDSNLAPMPPMHILPSSTSTHQQTGINKVSGELLPDLFRGSVSWVRLEQ
ncbi:uncharacterized protein PADG_06869 [Paracoccidioides brasiliensis Pb18]|uniref:Uncharacterized protein n=1 Tax=Paracoccidioides brasiliensis (strain Pb18) TaxID=502780 RepID=C1GHY3_PARBD|nr:uncharacterized protein PADG_06869 [Paracoccidioides brasiliensis Pb18]EEH50790.2 hypothetical protein PADG_06869 [Paracoccidioides brasiliensis Pb18]ODH46389.1 hypothetical protein GX48_07516 [Paracoccidioides brasiliensis]